jgi:uncharacterized protein YycO
MGNSLKYGMAILVLFVIGVGLQTSIAKESTSEEHTKQLINLTSPQHEADAQEVLAQIEKSARLKQAIPAFIEEANVAISEHKGAIPSALALKIAETIYEADNMRNLLFKQALNHRSALYRVDGQMSDNERITEIMIAMSAAVLLYDNHKAMREHFKSHDLLRQKLNEGYPELGIAPGFYQSSVTRAGNHEYRKAMSDAIQFFNDNQEIIKQHMALSSSSVQALNRYISQSSLLDTYKGGNVFREILRLPKKAVTGIVELPKEGLKDLKFNSSKAVGNTLGLVRWRDGKLKDDTALVNTMIAQLQPGDILLEKTPFTLTDKTIPGHFGHAAMYIGTADQLEALGMTGSIEVKKHLAKIKGGSGVVEALRDGVQLNSLHAFMNIDDVAVLRPKHLSKEQQIKAVKIALGNLGKRYDFNFDVNTTETIVCSELVYMAYPHIDFVTKRVLHSYTISPDDIALQAGEEDGLPLSLVLFVHDGQLVLDQHTNFNAHKLYASLVRPKNNQTAKQNKEFFDGFIARQ